MQVYPSRRSYSAPDAWYAGTFKNATRAYMDVTPDKSQATPQHAVAGIPFPILDNNPDAGVEAVWNERLRWRGPGRERSYVVAGVGSDGAANLVRMHERLRFQSIDAPPENKKIGTVLEFSARVVLEPAALVGALKLEYDAVLPPPQVWQFSPGQFRISRVADGGGDTPALGANDMVDEDQFEGYEGSPARYQWTLLGKRELLVPYNAARLHARGLNYADLLSSHHLNPQLARYELHRVWVVQGKCRSGGPCAYLRRTLYLDEDSWTVLAAELYDREDRLAGYQENQQHHGLRSAGAGPGRGSLLRPAGRTLPARRHEQPGAGNELRRRQARRLRLRRDAQLGAQAGRRAQGLSMGTEFG